MKKTTRRSFILKAAAGLAACGWSGRVCRAEADETLEPWRPGNLDLHFIYTGCGENMFYRLPDGTAVLNDVGEFYRPADLAEVPLLPSPDRLGGDWVSRYIRRVYHEREIDYALFSHWHSDHIGHALFDVPKSGKADYRFRVNAQGERICGFRCVTEDFRIRRCFDHQYPARGTYGTQDSSMDLLAPWIELEKKNGLEIEPFKVGALDQIRLQRDPEKYRGVFSIRNLCANGVVWDGRGGTVDYAAEHAAADERDKGRVAQNMHSMGFVMRYGKFSYLNCGDLQGIAHKMLDGTRACWDEAVGRAVGKVSVCKMFHHACEYDMSEGLVRNVRAGCYVCCMWAPRQSNPLAMARMLAAADDRNPPLILPQLLTPLQSDWLQARGLALSRPQAVHIVVRVEPGGERYRAYMLDARSEEPRVVARVERTC